MDLNKFLDKLLWAIMIGVASIGVSQMQSATSSINELNQKMAVVIKELSTQTQFIQDHEARLRRLERHVR